MGETEGLKLPDLMIMGIIGMLLLAIAIIVFFVVYQQRLLAQRDEIRQMELDYQKDLLHSSMQTQETERRRIAADLHDSIGSQLSAAKLYIKQMRHDKPPENLSFLREESLNLLDETIRNVRVITQNLLPPSLEQFGLAAALEDLSSRIRESGLLEIDCLCNRADTRFAPEQETAVYRIVQELINNTLKHAAANRAEIRTGFITDRIFALSYRDDGAGFDARAIAGDHKAKGLGLKNIESRANVLGAQVEWNSRPGEGVHMTLQFAL